MRVSVNTSKLVPPDKVMRELGVDERGRVQKYLTDRVLFRMRRYMPWLTGLTATSLTMVTSPATITVNAPYAQYLYNGVSPSGAPLSYTTDTNPLAGPRWDQKMLQMEGEVIAEEIAAYARSINGRA